MRGTHQGRALKIRVGSNATDPRLSDLIRSLLDLAGNGHAERIVLKSEARKRRPLTSLARIEFSMVCAGQSRSAASSVPGPPKAMEPSAWLEVWRQGAWPRDGS